MPRPRPSTICVFPERFLEPDRSGPSREVERRILGLSWDAQKKIPTGLAERVKRVLLRFSCAWLNACTALVSSANAANIVRTDPVVRMALVQTSATTWRMFKVSVVRDGYCSQIGESLQFIAGEWCMSAGFKLRLCLPRSWPRLCVPLFDGDDLVRQTRAA